MPASAVTTIWRNPDGSAQSTMKARRLEDYARGDENNFLAADQKSDECQLVHLRGCAPALANLTPQNSGVNHFFALRKNRFKNSYYESIAIARSPLAV
jgi:hypothetical protein